MRVGVDATPLLGTRTGIGRYTGSLLAALAGGPDELVATAFTLRGRLPPMPGVQVRQRPAPARGLQAAWARSQWPPVELLTGRLDVFHATNFVLPPLRRARGVVTVHDLAFLRMTETVSAASARYRDLVPRSVRRASVVLTPSEAVAEQVRQAYAPVVPVVAVPHGVDPGWGTALPPNAAHRARLGLPAQYLLFVGTFEPRKDVATLIAAHALLPGAPPLVLVGPPGWGEHLDVSGCITPGFLDDEDLRPVVAGASALVLPSRDEGFGLPVLEALAAGTPVVCSDLPVLREVGGAHAAYAAVGDAEAFAAALAAVLADPPDPAPGRAYATGFTWARCAERHRDAYTLALS
ncbi:MAG: glycosyltransferase family 4 protein [Frankiales bacterium]|nr:glycosyltransferase family 4 protein [Frankiales bacterium]